MTYFLSVPGLRTKGAPRTDASVVFRSALRGRLVEEGAGSGPCREAEIPAGSNRQARERNPWKKRATQPLNGDVSQRTRRWMKASKSSRHHPLLRQGANPRRLDWERSYPTRGEAFPGVLRACRGSTRPTPSSGSGQPESHGFPSRKRLQPGLVSEAAESGAEIHRTHA